MSSIALRLLPAVSTGCALALAVCTQMPWSIVIGLLLVGAGCLVLSRPVFLSRIGLVAAWAGFLLVLGGMLFAGGDCYTFGCYMWFTGDRVDILNNWYAFVPWFCAGTILSGASRAVVPALQRQWRILGLVCAFIGALIWLVAAYGHNYVCGFHLGLVQFIVAILLCRHWFRGPWLKVLANTLLLAVVCLPLADLGMRWWHSREVPLTRGGKYYLYESAKADPRAYMSWWRYYSGQIQDLNQAKMTDPDHVLPYRLRPGAQFQLGDCSISINHQGMRGREIPEAKGSTYRIVVLGESSTFGVTLTRDHSPWPELLEQFIRERLRPARPVEVINAGVPGYSLSENLYRIRREILPLQPDLIISYHGYNGFGMIAPVPAQFEVPAPPFFQPRPLQLLADAEFGLKMRCYRRQYYRPTASLQPLSLHELMASSYADAYRRLIQIAATNQVRLVLANFSMAVDLNSDPDVIEFYRIGFPFVYPLMRANVDHSTIVRTLATEHPEVTFVDTHPGLDGNHLVYLDLMHFDPDGDRLLAENMFAGLRKLLETELARP